MNTDQELQIQAYLDNELPPAEARKVAGIIAGDLEAQELYRELKDTKELVAANEAPLRLREPREFYFSQIQRRIEAAEVSSARPAHRISWFNRLFLPFAGAAALVALVATLLHKDVAPTPPPVAVNQPALNLENSEEDTSTITFRSETEGVTVVWVSARDEE